MSVPAGSCRLLRDPPVLKTPSLYGTGPVGKRIMSLYNLPDAAAFPPGNCSDTTGWAYRLSHPECRSLPHWCDLPDAQARDAPPSFGGKLPCGLVSRCARGLRSVRFFHGQDNRSLSRCLRNRRIAMVGDSALQELMAELAMTLSRDVPAFTSAFLSLGYKVKAKTATTRIEAGPLTAELWPHTRNWTFHDSRLNLTVQFVHSGALFLRDHMGIQTLTHPAFAPELDRLGLSAGAPAQRRPHMAVFGTTFHDDVQLGGPCADASKNSCGCAAEPAGDPSSKHFPQNLTWPQRMQRYRYHAAGAARLVTGLQAAGTRVVHLSLFPRYAGVDEFIRAAADEMLFSELKAAGFFSAGGRYMDQWPIYTGYFELSREHRADFGPSSLHYSQLSVRDRMMTNDLSLARLTLLLNGWCTSAAEASSPCGVGSQFLPLAGYVQELDATCSCGPFGMSITTPKLCQSDEASLADANGTAPHRVRKHPLPPYSKWQNAPAAEGTANDWSPFKRADAILTGAVLDPEWPGREGPYHGGRPWFVPEGGVDPKPYRVDATAEGIGQAAACGHPV